MDRKKEKVCYIIAGPNGAGKTTFALKYLPKIVACNNFINADEIAKGISPLDFERGLLQASKIFLAEVDKKIKDSETFAFETTLSGKSYLPKIKNWQKMGWKVILWYLYIPSAEFSALRVTQRVIQGGHNIPLADINRRFPRSIKNLFEYAEVCNEIRCFDNTNNQVVPIFEKHIGKNIAIFDEDRYAKLLQVKNNE